MDQPSSTARDSQPDFNPPLSSASRTSSSLIPDGDVAIETQKHSSEPSTPLASPMPETKLSHETTYSPYETRPPPSLVSTYQTTRKRLPWRGKACIILLPQHSKRELGDYKYLTQHDNDARLEEWQARGYDTAGFLLGHEFEGSHGSLPGLRAQTRPSFPDPEDIRSDREQRFFRVNIPVRAPWETYVESIREAKLHALGVSLGENSSAAQKPPIKHSLSHQSSSHGLSLSITPTVTVPRSACTSSTYGGATQARDLPATSWHVSPATNMKTQASANASVRQFPRCSIAQLQKPSGVPLPLLGPRSGSPFLPQIEPADYGVSRSSSRTVPSTPERALPMSDETSAPEKLSIPESRNALHRPDADYSIGCAEWPQNGWNKDIVDFSHKEELYDNISYPASMNLQHSEDEQKQYAISPTNHLHTPVPHNRRDGLLETLERRLHEAVKSKSATQPQLQKENLQARAQSPSSIPVLGVDHVGHCKSAMKAPDGVSSEVTPDFPKQQVISKHTPSSLNALAPEFRSETAVFSFISPTADATMRPTASAFTPAAAAQLTPASQEFNFSFSGPSFRRGNIDVQRDPPGGERSEGEPGGMLSRVQYPLISKPVRKSKAIPIHWPRDEQRICSREIEVQEDESGRITQAEGRQKRVRRSNRDLGQCLVSEESAQELSSPDERQDPTKVHKVHHAPLNGISLEKAAQAADQLKEIIDDLSASESSGSQDPDAGLAHVQQRVLTSTAACEAVKPDAIVPSSLSITMKAVRSTSSEMLYASCKSADEELALCESKLEQARETPASSPVLHVSNLQQSQVLADFGIFESLHRDDFSTTHLDPHRSSSGSSKDHTQAKSHLLPSAGQGRNYELKTRDDYKGIPAGVSYVEPSYEEYNEANKNLDEMMSRTSAQSNGSLRKAGDGDGVGALDFRLMNHPSETTKSTSPPNDAQNEGLGSGAAKVHQHLPLAESESVGSSIVEMIAANGRSSPSYPPFRGSDIGSAALRGSGSAASSAISEWDNGSSSNDEVRIEGRRSFFHAHVNDVVGNILQIRLAPLEESLAGIRNTLTDMSKQSSRGADLSRALDIIDASDADDEEDLESIPLRTKSPIRLPNSEKIKALVTQIATAQLTAIPANQYAGINEEIKALKTLFEENRPFFADVKTVVEEAITKQMRGRSAPIASSHQSATVERNQLQIAGLESMLKVAEGRAEDELKARRATEDALADSQRLLRLALQDAAEQRESAEETERSLSAFYEERHEALRRNAMLEGAQESLQRTASELAEKNAALEGTLEEYRLSSARWRNEIENTKMENSDLRRTISSLKNEIEDGIRNRHALRARFDQLQYEMAQASQNILHDHSVWRTREEELKAECRMHATDLERERKRSDQLENQIAALSDNVRCEREEHYQITAQYERKIHDQREMASLETDRVQRKLDNDSAAATDKLDSMRSDLEEAIAKLHSQLEQANMAATMSTEKFQICLQEAITSKTVALQQHQDFHDWVVKGLKEQHEQVSRNEARERQTLELQSKGQLNLADEKMLHYEDKIRHLENKVVIANSAAQAAAYSAHSQQSTPGVLNQHGSSSSIRLPEKISPQALRESILVLQEQLQEREGQIEKLEQKFCAVDIDAPTKLKAQKTEITWLRELLSVRTDDLDDLITALAQPIYDREAIKDAAIRLKASLQMEQQEKDRAYSPEQPPATSLISTGLTSSPRTLPLAAAAAWANWRKGWNLPIPYGHSVHTPLRASPSAESVPPGLLTPPDRNAHPSRSERSATILQKQNPFSPKTMRKPREASSPATPSLTLKASYDVDAVTANVEDMHDTVETQETDMNEAVEEEPFGPPLVTFSRIV